MKKFTKITSKCLPLRAENVDTDQIVPARFLKITSREGFGKYLFYDWRFDERGKPKKNKYFDESINRSAKILVAGNNFGCGSSREHAAWALMDYGFNVVISSSFGDIFYNNALKNGLLPIILSPNQLEQLFTVIEKYCNTQVTVDLENQTIEISSARLTYNFTIDNFRKTCLLKGVYELGYILSQEEKIAAFELQHKIYITG